jgi:hypothetical protein
MQNANQSSYEHGRVREGDEVIFGRRNEVIIGVNTVSYLMTTTLTPQEYAEIVDIDEFTAGEQTQQVAEQSSNEDYLDAIAA